jgi:nitrite reductase/ring-hydroxylating ferredoxin subunit
MTFVKAVRVSDVQVGKMMHLELGGKEIMIANVGGKFYALGDRCGHMNARLSMGALNKNIVTCPLHFSKFDVTTGKLLSGPVMMQSSTNMFEKCPEEVQKMMNQMMQKMGEIQKEVKTHDVPIYEAKVEGNAVFVDI